jgi:putative copper export protein
LRFIFYIHLLSATVWVGGLVVLGGLVPAVRKTTDDRSVIQAIAKRFGVMSWTALGLLVLTGTLMVFDRVWTGTLITKIGLVMLSALLAVWHTMAAREQSPAVRGAIQGVILILALVILWLATTL